MRTDKYVDEEERNESSENPFSFFKGKYIRMEKNETRQHAARTRLITLDYYKGLVDFRRDDATVQFFTTCFLVRFKSHVF